MNRLTTTAPRLASTLFLRGFSSEATQLLRKAEAIGEGLRTLPEKCAEILAVAESVELDDEALYKFGASISEADLKPPPASSVSEIDADSLACLLAWNAVNFSYFPSENENRWYCEISGTVYGQDDEANGGDAATRAPRLPPPSWLLPRAAAAAQH